jgi:hypothetical protein
MLKKILMTLVITTPYFLAQAQTEEKPTSKTTFSGFVDTYYKFDFSKQNNTLTSFSKAQNSFELGMASVKVEHTSGKVSAVADLGFGNRATEFAYNDAGTVLEVVKQAYVSYQATSKIKFTAGSWATHIGYELVDPYANKNYSMSYLFTNGPFTHTGVKADITLDASNAIMIGVANPTDFRTDPLSGKQKTLLAQYAYTSKNSKFKAWLNFVSGRFFTVTSAASTESKRNQIDLVASYAISSKTNIALNYTMNNDKAKSDIDGKFGSNNSWSGVDLYFAHDFSDKFGIGIRPEYVMDDKGRLTGIDNNILAVTVSPNIKLGALTIIPELRYESAKEKIFVDSKSAPTKSSFNALVAAIYKF